MEMSQRMEPSPATRRQRLAATFSQMRAGQLPNLFRLYLNPYVAQACLCLERYAQGSWPARKQPDGQPEPFQTFLANGFDEALGGAIKLGRFCATAAQKTTDTLVIDCGGRLGPFASAAVNGGAERIDFVLGLTTVGDAGALRSAVASAKPVGLIVLVRGGDEAMESLAGPIREVMRRDQPLVITVLDRVGLAAIRAGSGGILGEITPDIVVFDESFVEHDVPFAAFTGRKTYFDHWNQPGRTNFHSTTYQPNTISTLHFMRCLEAADPAFFATVAVELSRALDDFSYRVSLFRRLYSPSLFKAIRATECDTPDVRASGDFVYVGSRKIFDGVSGVACSIRGHNPPGYADEIEKLADVPDCAAEVQQRLTALTGLACSLPAVSGATAVENALKLALVAQNPRRQVLAMRSGFGGKTLFSLTGTWKSYYKEGIGPLYGDVSYIDPFAPDAIAQIDAALAQHPTAVVQIELVQGVGGVRPVPPAVVQYLAAGREKWGYLLLVDEVQTGMFRTGPFTRSQSLGITPDLLVIGKGTSDMMFPFAFVLYSRAIQMKLDGAGSDLPAILRQRYGYEYGYRTVLNVLRWAEQTGLAQRVAESGKLVTRLLEEGLAGCRAVRDIRVFGMLIGIELDSSRGLRRLLHKRLFFFYLSAMLRHPRYPVLIGFCQYEPNILKITPSLMAEPQEIASACQTIVEVLRRPFAKLVAVAIGSLVRLKLTKNKTNRTRRTQDGSAVARANEPAAC